MPRGAWSGSAGVSDQPKGEGKMYYLYIIKSLAKNYIYVGLTNNIKRRINQHNTGKEKTTSPYKPFKLIYTELSSDRKSARIIEKY